MIEDLRVVEFDPLTDDDLLRGWVDAGLESAREEFGDRHTVYSLEEVRERSRSATDRRFVMLAAVLDGEVVGEANLHLPLKDNLHFTYQTGDNHSLTIDTTGNGNKVLASNWKGEKFGGQFGSSQTAQVKQNGNGNSVNFNQEGMNQVAKLEQKGNRNTMETNQVDGNNELYFEQNGSDNLLIAAQRDGGNYAEGLSAGNGNVINLDQSGQGNQSYTYQLYGSGNTANITQTDVANVAYVTQGGTGNLATVTQSNMNQNAAITQYGSTNTAIVTQQ